MSNAAIDRRLRAMRDIIQVDVGNRGLARDPLDNLVTACPDDFADACRSIAEHASPRVGIVTGFMIPSVDPPTGETDGPLGALFLAHALSRLDIPCVLASDAAGFPALRVGIQRLQLSVERVDLSATSWSGHSVTGLLGSREPEAVLPSAEAVRSRSDRATALTHLIAIERSGPSHSNGRNHTMRGRDITHLTAPAHLLFEGPRDYITIGIGDGGNEIGMGKVPFATICKNIPNGEVVACRTATDFLIVAGVSNWGAYALAAGVTLLRGAVDVTAFDPTREFKLLEHLVEHGPLVDGVTGQRTPTVDGLSFADYAKPLEQIAAILAPGGGGQSKIASRPGLA
jgi:hypothetical protein